MSIKIQVANCCANCEFSKKWHLYYLGASSNTKLCLFECADRKLPGYICRTMFPFEFNQSTYYLVDLLNQGFTITEDDFIKKATAYQIQKYKASPYYVMPPLLDKRASKYYKDVVNSHEWYLKNGKYIRETTDINVCNAFSPAVKLMPKTKQAQKLNQNPDKYPY